MATSHILIIDAEKAVRDSFGAHLEDCGYVAVTAENGRKGLDLFEKERPDLVIVDLRMPEFDGRRVLDRISRTSPLTPLIVASGTAIITDAIDALRNGAWDYLLKPIENWSILTHAVEAALEKGRLKRENLVYREHLEKRVEVDQEKLGSQLHQARKMEALGTLAGGIAHDFNNILSTVLGYSELGLQDLDDSAHPLYSKLKAINNAGHRARALVEQILTFSRVQEQLQAPIKVSPIVREALKLVQSCLPANIQVQETIPADRPVLGDPTQIHQIVMNLCTNAHHAMQASGGVLKVSLEQVAVDASETVGTLGLPAGQYLRLAVADTGTGIRPAIIDRIFDPYFTTKDKGEGTGLGLAVVQGIVKRHGGEIAVESRVGEGTRVTVFLPVSEHEMAEHGLRRAGLPRGTEHVLLVDDEKALVAIGSEMLKRLGYRVTAIIGSTDALEAFRQDPFRYDIVVTDYNMPGLTGDQLARQMLSIRREMPIIVCTGFSEVFDQQRAQAIGIRRTLVKPVTMQAIAHAVREVLETC